MVYKKEKMNTRENELKSLNKLDITDTKYGDADLTSKRRKLHKIKEQEEYEDEDDTYLNFVEKIDKHCLHSSFSDASTSQNDFENSISSSPHKTKSSAKNNLIISNKPSLTSKGFENSFKLLQSQVQANSKKKKQLLENLNTNHKLSTSSETNLYTVKEEDPTRLELELEALQRIQKFVSNLEKEKCPAQLLKSGHILTPHLVLLYNFVSKGLSKDSLSTVEKNLETKCNSYCGIEDDSNLKYHVGKNACGEKCLKIIRSFLNHEKGTFSFPLTKLIITLFLNS